MSCLRTWLRTFQNQSRPWADHAYPFGETMFCAIQKVYSQLSSRRAYSLFQNKRSNIEATNAAIKRKFGETLKSKNPVAQINELLAKIIAYNLTVVIHEMYENGIQPEFLQINSDICKGSPSF